MQIHHNPIHDRGSFSRLDAFDPRSRVICALFFAIALASVRSYSALAVGAIIPLLLVFVGDLKTLAKALVRLNAVSVFACILLPFTYQVERFGEFSFKGLELAMIITVKLNLISIVFLRMILPLGVSRIENVLEAFRVPEKIRVLLLLTMRYILLLSERVTTMTRAIFLRAPGVRGKRMLLAFSCMLGTTMIHSSDRASRSLLAMQLRGGIAGFSQYIPTFWRSRDTFLCACFFINITAIAIAVWRL